MIIRNDRDANRWHDYAVAAASSGKCAKDSANLADDLMAEYIARCGATKAEISEAEKLFKLARGYEDEAKRSPRAIAEQRTDTAFLDLASEARAKGRRLSDGHTE